MMLKLLTKQNIDKFLNLKIAVDTLDHVYIYAFAGLSAFVHIQCVTVIGHQVILNV